MASWVRGSGRARGVVVVACVASLTTGCELLVDFDRSLIDGGSDDGSIVDGAMPPADATPGPDGGDTGTVDATPMDAALDATSPDGSVDSGPDASPLDSAPDAPADSGVDAADGGENDASDGGEDAASDANDAGADAAVDAGNDAGLDGGNDAAPATLANGAACSGNGACTSGVCGVAGTGNCCAAACGSVGSTCGAMACDVTGACVFPSMTTSCATSCAGNTLTTLGCDGTGACASTGGTTASCPSHLVCAGATSCAAGCGANDATGDANCVTGYFCDGVGAGACQLPLTAGGSCNRASQCTSTNCVGSTCVEATVLVVGAGASSSFGAALHPSTLGSGTWSTPTSLGAPSVSDLGLAFISSGATPEAVGALRYTLMGDPLDQTLVYTTWSEASGFSQLTAVSSGTTTREVPAIAGAGGSAFVSFQGIDFNLYFAEYDGATWTPTPPEAVGVGGTPTPAGIAAIGSNVSIAYFAMTTNAPTAQDRTTTWQAATTLGADDSFVATPSIVAMDGGTAELLTVYIRQSDGALVYDTRTSGVWSTSQAIAGATAPASSTFGPVERVGLAALPSGGAIVTWRDASTSGIYYALYAAGSWSAPIAFATPNAVVAAAPAITHGAVGATAEMAFVASDGNAYHARLVGGAWTSPVQAISGGAVDHVAIATSP